MKTASPDLVAFLRTARYGVRPDLLTLTLRTGTVLRYSLADVPITFGNTTWQLGPKIDRSGVKSKRGVVVSTVQLTFYPEETDLIEGVPLLPFIRSGGLDGASVLLETAFGPTFVNLAGKLVMESGRVTSIIDITPSEVTVEVSSWLELLNVNMPQELIQPPCLHTLYDSGCGLNRASLAQTGAVTAAADDRAFTTDLVAAAGRFSLGTIRFDTGANAGQLRTVRSSDAAGGFIVVLGLPFTPAVGDAFTAYPGCDRAKTTCSTKFGNLARFKGQPYVPTPESSV